ncbi:NTPase [candidate division KSB1 bacterium]
MSSISSQKINILLTGKPGIGKTTVIKRVIEKYKNSIGGFFSEEIREKGIRSGFRIKNINGEEGLLSHVGINSRFRIGKYSVNVDDIDRIGVNSIDCALNNDNVNIIIIDEIAKMELFSKNFKNAVLRALDSKKIVIAVIQDKDIKFLNRIKERNDVKLICIDYSNRNKVAEDIFKIIESNY